LVKIALQIEPENSIALQFKDILEEKTNTSSQHVQGLLNIIAEDCK
jgi:hypothetical protein